MRRFRGGTGRCVWLLVVAVSLSAALEGQQYRQVDFQLLAGFDYSAAEPFEPSPRPVKNGIPPAVKALHGQQVEIDGKVLPLQYEGRRMTTFLLNASSDVCGFGGAPRLNEWIAVALRSGRSAALVPPGTEVRVRGTLSVGEDLYNGRVVGLYSLVADDVR
jgi:hypothetical protein